MSKNTTVKNPMKVITGENIRWSYANVWEPKSINDGTRYCGCGSESDPHPFGGLLRCVWPCQHHFVRLQLQRQPWYLLRLEQPAEDP